MQRAAFKYGILYEKIQRLKTIADKISPQLLNEDKFRPAHDVQEALKLISQINKICCSVAAEFVGEEE